MERNLRQIHLDFHTPDFVQVGDKFKRKAFFDVLEEAEVNALAFFALCHHGHSYFNTTTGVRHPGLEFDLLAQVAEEARRRKIELLVYFSLNVNEVQAARHPDWHAQFADGRSVNTQNCQDGTELFWTWLCPNRGDFLESFFYPQLQEVLDHYPLDGVFVDMACYLPGSCHCEQCRSQMQARGLDPQNEAIHAAFGVDTIDAVAREVRRRLDAVRQDLRMEIHCYNAYGAAQRAVGVISEFYIESLAFQTGWDYFPMAARYFRRYGVPIMGMTGRFVKNWGDFGTVVSPAQLKTQVGYHLMAGASSCIGDHLHCNGALDKAVYKTIGEVYRWLKPRQPYAVGMTPINEVAILAPVGLEGNAAAMANHSAAIQDAVMSASLMMTELHRPYAVIVEEDSLDDDAALIMPHSAVDDDFIEKARKFVLRGGAIVAAAHALGGSPAWREFLGVTSFAMSDDDGEFYEITDKRFKSDDLPDMAHYVHQQALNVKFAADVKTLALDWRSPCKRTRGRHYGHFHGPAHRAAGAAIGVRKVGRGKLILIRPQLFTAYLRTSYFAHRLTIRNLLDAAVPARRRALKTNAPSTVDVSVGRKDGKVILQVQPMIAARRHRSSFESISEPIAVHDIWVELFNVGKIRQAKVPGSREKVKLTQIDGGVRVALPPFSEHLLVALSE